MRALVRILLVAATSLALSGCLTLGRIETRGTTVDESVGTMQNRWTLLNLVRASRGEPLTFLSLTSVQAQGAADIKIGAPSFNEGPRISSIAAQKLFAFNTGGSTFFDNSTNTNMALAVYNTQAFYSGMLQPLGLDEVDLLLHQGFPRELIFYLVIDKVKLTDQQTGVSRIIYNDPTSPTYDTFKLAIQAAMDHGLTTEVAPGPEHAAAAGPSASATGIAAVTQPPGGAEKGPAPHAEECFEKALATDVALDEFAELQKEGKTPNFCGEPHAAGPQQLTVRLFGRDTEVEVTTRSTYGMFSYLGAVLNIAGSADAPRLIDYGKDYQTRDKTIIPPERTPEGPLVNVNGTGGPLGSGCFTAVGYSGQTYCVPQQDSLITKDIFNVLTVLVALKQSPGDLPASQTVLIAP